MKIKLQGIGIIKDSEIELNGLTVITGDNNSGKTTVGKVVYSLFDAVSDLQMKAEVDKKFYAFKVLQNIQSNLAIYYHVYNKSKNASKSSALSSLFSNGFVMELNAKFDMMAYAHKIYEETKVLSKIWQDVLDDIEKKALFSTIAKFHFKGDVEISKIVEFIEHQFDQSIFQLEKLMEALDSDVQLIDYARKNISQTLKVEFSGQIQPVKVDVKKSVISVNDKTPCFHFEIIDNKINETDEPVYFGSPINRTFFVDNPFVLDLEYDDDDYDMIVRNSEGVLNVNRIQPHEMKLKNFLRKKETSIFEDSILERQYRNINAKINEVISGDFEFSNDGDYYVDKGRKLRFSNLATGSKLFSILKLLINKGALTESTVLVLDEPEAHLHPAWQNKFAEIIVMLVKELNVKILLTSHSPNFVLAIDAFTRQYKIDNITKFYQTHILDDGFAEYYDIEGDMDIIYSDFAKYFSDMRLLRDEYITFTGDDDDD